VLDEYKYTSGLTDHTVKMTMPSPSLLYLAGGRDAVSRDAYPDIEEYFEDLTGLYRDEIKDLAALGCRYVQIDHTDAARLCDPNLRAQAEAQGRDPLEDLAIQARLVSLCTRGRPDDVTVSMHICRGNSHGGWFAEGGYDFVAEKLFSDFDVDAFFLEYDTERAGDFTPLRFAPKDKRIVLGLVTTKTPQHDDKDTLKRRIDEAAKFVPLENLALSPQCGFASGARGNPISFDDERRKLELIVEVAEEIWGTAGRG
jgi:5-methyltetrahydropteroyltriglutamate--homocysteine methyltransferase